MSIRSRGQSWRWRLGVGAVVGAAGVMDLQSREGLMTFVVGLLAGVVGADLAVAGAFDCDPLYARLARAAHSDHDG